MADPEISLTDNTNNDDPDIPLTDGVGSELPVPLAPVTMKSKVWSDSDFEVLRQQGYPLGLAKELVDAVTKTFPIRFWIVDNSGSMQTTDGLTFLDTSSKDDIQVIASTRWKELAATVTYHAQLAGLLQATTIFRLLNEPSQAAGPQEFSINENGPSFIENEVQVAQNCMKNSGPGGYTPLAKHINAVRERIEAVAPNLRREGQKAVVVLATDGMPTTEYGQEDTPAFIQSLRALQALPVWVIVRLCTGEVNVVDFYNNIDAQLESPIDVIDDFFGEGKEIFKMNSWLNYTLPLHRCREFGYRNRLFDLLDERRLTKDELLEFVIVIFGKAALEGAPNVHSDWNGFIEVLSKVVSKEGPQWNPITKKLSPWVDIGKLEIAFGTRGSGCC